jgi:hypothetical protein
LRECISIDVRSKTGSRNLHFDEKRFRNLSKMCAEAGVKYNYDLHTVLGGFQNGKTKIGNFREYTRSGIFQSGLVQLEKIVKDNEGQSVNMCCERDYKACHRRIIFELMN